MSFFTQEIMVQGSIDSTALSVLEQDTEACNSSMRQLSATETLT